MGGIAQRMAPDEIGEHLKRYSREPFVEELTSLLACKPDENSIKKFAKRWPDRWAQTITQFARLAGYTEKVIGLDITNNYYLTLKQSSDLELNAQYIKLKQQLEAIDITPVAEPDPTVNITQSLPASIK